MHQAPITDPTLIILRRPQKKQPYKIIVAGRNVSMLWKCVGKVTLAMIHDTHFNFYLLVSMRLKMHADADTKLSDAKDKHRLFS